MAIVLRPVERSGVFASGREKVMKARFFCDNCGREVAAGASLCPACGRPFKGVRCPECGYVGSASEFGRGCPSCGFLEQEKREPEPARAGPQAHARVLPALFYRVAAGVLIALMVLLVALLLFRD